MARRLTWRETASSTLVEDEKDAHQTLQSPSMHKRLACWITPVNEFESALDSLASCSPPLCCAKPSQLSFLFSLCLFFKKRGTDNKSIVNVSFLENVECCLFLAENLRSGQIRKKTIVSVEKCKKIPPQNNLQSFGIGSSSKSMLISYKPEKSMWKPVAIVAFSIYFHENFTGETNVWVGFTWQTEKSAEFSQRPSWSAERTEVLQVSACQLVVNLQKGILALWAEQTQSNLCKKHSLAEHRCAKTQQRKTSMLSLRQLCSLEGGSSSSALCSHNPLFPRPYVIQTNIVDNGTMRKAPIFPGLYVPKF